MGPVCGNVLINLRYNIGIPNIPRLDTKDLIPFDNGSVIFILQGIRTASCAK